MNRPKELAAKSKAEADAKKAGKVTAPAVDQEVPAAKSAAVSISDRSFLSALLAGRGAGATPVGKLTCLLTDAEVGGKTPCCVLEDTCHA